MIRNVKNILGIPSDFQNFQKSGLVPIPMMPEFRGYTVFLSYVECLRQEKVTDRIKIKFLIFPSFAYVFYYKSLVNLSSLLCNGIFSITKCLSVATRLR